MMRSAAQRHNDLLRIVGLIDHDGVLRTDLDQNFRMTEGERLAYEPVIANAGSADQRAIGAHLLRHATWHMRAAERDNLASANCAALLQHPLFLQACLDGDDSLQDESAGAVDRLRQAMGMDDAQVYSEFGDLLRHISPILARDRLQLWPQLLARLPEHLDRLRAAVARVQTRFSSRPHLAVQRAFLSDGTDGDPYVIPVPGLRRAQLVPWCGVKNALIVSHPYSLDALDVRTGQKLAPTLYPGATIIDFHRIEHLDHGPTILIWCDDGELGLWDCVMGERQVSFQGHQGMVLGALWFDNPGHPSRLVSWSTDRTVRFWDGATGAEHVRAVAVDDDFGVERVVARAGKEQAVVIWTVDGAIQACNATNGDLFGSLIQTDGAIAGVCAGEMRDGGLRVCVWTNEGEFSIWNLMTGRRLCQIKDAEMLTHGAVWLTLAGVDSFVARLGQRGEVEIFDPSTGRLSMRVVGAGGQGTPTGVVAIDGGAKLLVWFVDGSLTVWDAATGRQVAMHRHDDFDIREGRWIADFRGDGPAILSYASDSTFHFWRPDTGDLAVAPIVADQTVTGIDWLSTRDGGGTLSAWTLEGAVAIHTFAGGHRATYRRAPSEVIGEVCLVEKSGEPPAFLNWTFEGSVTLRDVRTGCDLGNARLRDAMIEGAAPGWDRAQALAWSDDNVVRQFNLISGVECGPRLPHSTYLVGVQAMRLQSGGHGVLTWGGQGSVCIWDAVHGKVLAATGEQMQGVRDVRWIESGRMGPTILMNFEDGRVAVRDGDTLGLRFPDLRHPEPVTCCAWIEYCDDGPLIATGCTDGGVRLWRGDTGVPVVPELMFGSPLKGMCLAADEQTLMVWCEDGTLAVQDVTAPASQIARLEHHDEVIGCRDFSLDSGKRGMVSWTLASAYVWEMDTGRLIGGPFQHEGSVTDATLACKTAARPLLISISDGAIPAVNLWDVDTGARQSYVALDASPSALFVHEDNVVKRVSVSVLCRDGRFGAFEICT